MMIGYARISTSDQDHALQRDALTAAGCTRIVEETASGSKTDRPQLMLLMDMMRDGDVLVVWKLDRLGRSMRHLIETIDDLNKRNIGFRCLTQNIDTTTANGRLVFGVFAAMAEFERSLIIERTKAGLEAAKKRGTKLGAKHKLSKTEIAGLRARHANNEPIRMIARDMGIHHKTAYRYLGADALK